MISNETIKDFQNTIKSEHGVLLSFEEAQSVLKNLVGYFDLLAKINHREKSQKSNLR